ncbi:hypothetical protein K438DRAFT_1781864 [Mycena galopus ATCC 62051]|nr:hypothetical protein K438DRAFT_1781864 [Mycena galopus ATCC 62051]
MYAATHAWLKSTCARSIPAQMRATKKPKKSRRKEKRGALWRFTQRDGAAIGSASTSNDDEEGVSAPIRAHLRPASEGIPALPKKTQEKIGGKLQSNEEETQNIQGWSSVGCKHERCVEAAERSNDGVHICGTPYGRGRPVGEGKNDREVQACTQIYVCMACVCKHPSAKDRPWPNGNRDKEELRKYARRNEETGK